MKVCVAHSHKGGTGRSVTLANIAYHFATKGKDVCIIDLDMASPTMGAILGLQGIETGVLHTTIGMPRHVGDLLSHEDRAAQATHAVVDAWSNSEDLRDNYQSGCGRFSLIPGQKRLGDEIRPGDFASRIPIILDAISSEYDIVFLDIRSGISNVLRGLSIAERTENTRGHKLISAWLIHYRWTRQHICGVADLFGDQELEGISIDDRERVFLIRTLYIDPVDCDNWFRSRHDELNTHLNAVRPQGVRTLGDIPLDPMLQWQECVITPTLLDLGIAKKATANAFTNIARHLEEWW